jgi:hypothetical protein
METSPKVNTNVLSTSCHAPQFIPVKLPDGNRNKMDFLDTKFFKLNKSLPTPAEVRALSKNTDNNGSRPVPVTFDHLDLIVKFGPQVSVVEAICLWGCQEESSTIRSLSLKSMDGE